MDLPLTIKQTQKGLLRKEFSAVELVDAYLLRIRTFDKDLNAFITISDELAYKQAKKVDKIINELGDEALTRHPLLGVTVAHKDLFLTKGIRTTAASKVLTNYVPAYSATVVRRLENAGCIMIGKTNCDAWAHGSSGENSDFGSTKNPWDKEYVPGGSSSGSGAALAANFSLITTGTDTCGSIRLPANYCGVVGFKPTYGTVSRYGVIAMASSLDSVGHLAHCVDDIERVFKITKGVDNKDSTVCISQLPATSYQLPKRIGIPKEFFTDGLEREVEKSVLDTIAILKKEGVEFVDIALPHTKYAISVYYIIQPAEVSSNLNRYDGILSAGYYDAYYLKAMKVRSIIKNEIDEAFKKVDAIIAPVSPTTAFKLGEKVDDPLQMYLTDIFAATANLSGIPSLAIPSGFSRSGLPLGFQLMGPQFSEPTLFKLGKLYEKASGWKPKIASLT
jgi:aspartyl-tRNA(Asn)/glutamyl-tRNA(Gln) amidotransferase subunit A